MRIIFPLLLFLLLTPFTCFAQSDGILLGVNASNQLIAIDPETYDEAIIGTINVPDVTGLAYDSRRGVLFGITSDGKLLSIGALTARARVLQTLAGDPPFLFSAIASVQHEGASSLLIANAVGQRDLYFVPLQDELPFLPDLIAPLDFQITGMANHPLTDVLYGINRNNNALAVIDKTTGAITTFPHAGINNPENITFNEDGSKLLGIFSPGVIGSYNLDNGQATFEAITTSVSALTFAKNFFDEGRPQVIAEYVDADIQSSHPYGDGQTPSSPIVQRFTINHAGATYLSVYFNAFEMSAGDYVLVKSPDGSQVFRYEQSGITQPYALEGFWSAPIYNETLVVELHRTSPGTSYGFRIGLYARGFTKSEIQNFPANRDDIFVQSSGAVCENDLRNVECYASSEQRAYSRTKPVIRMIVQGRYGCTAFLFGGDNLALTNHHCFNFSDPDLNLWFPDSHVNAANTKFEFNAQGAQCSTDCSARFSCTGVIESQRGFIISQLDSQDYALVKLQDLYGNNLPINLSSKYGYLQARITAAQVGERIYVPQHVNFAGKTLALESSFASDPGYPVVTGVHRLTPPGCGEAGVITPDWLSSHFDSNHGGSGAPVLAYSDDLVVGLNACGKCSTEVSRAVGIDRILSTLAQEGNLPACAFPNTPGCPPSGVPTFSQSQCSSCAIDADCQVGLDCRNNLCIPSGLFGAYGQMCCIDAHCLSNQCQNNRCSCLFNHDCPNGMQCKIGLTGKLLCLETGEKESCKSCLQDKACASGVCNNRKCITPKSVPMGSPCCRNAECKSGKCHKFGVNSRKVCECRKNSDCSLGEYCANFPKANRPNLCLPLRPVCDSCTSHKQCGRGKRCKLGRCIERGVTLPKGNDCCRDSQCSTRHCNGKTGKCDCRTNTDCSSGQYCKKGLRGNTCVEHKAECSSCTLDKQCGDGATCKGFKCQTKSKQLGESCCGDYQCHTNSCNSSGQCQCKQSSDCPSGQYCALGVLGIGKNQCKAYEPECSNCLLDKHCGPGRICKLFQCIAPSSKPKGASCCRDAQCQSGKCKRGSCK